ncbi:ACT domain-containing protein [Selenomonas sp. F0473]|uniref:ACT domain-containing protein n=1 Tax=Selenomonas sp. F0473 TaxID=999423 RepID=UPI00029DDC4D|nr:ACT domain-containing protein [Selenomonas sp. F0473]EKU71575.1 hypothetical protein HMPREF9161_00260 [Selenomonas sp. F0473]
MTLELLQPELSVCKVSDTAGIDLTQDLYFIGKTDEELSLVCRTEYVPPVTEAREDGWRAFRIAGTLDFSLVGVLAPLAGLLAERRISIFAVSTYNTDYILVRSAEVETAVAALGEGGYEVVRDG